MKHTFALRAEGLRAPEAAIALSSDPSGALYRYFLLSITILLLAAMVRAADFYAAPGGSASGNGSSASPWDLQTALNQTVTRPGDTIWLRGGVYGSESAYLNNFDIEGNTIFNNGSIVTFSPNPRPPDSRCSSRTRRATLRPPGAGASATEPPRRRKLRRTPTQRPARTA
jgi:hypothetical protein